MKSSGRTPNALHASCLLVLTVSASSILHGQQRAEQTHVERFAPQAERLRAAERDAEGRVRAYPSQVRAWLDLGMAHLNLAELDAATAAFRRAATLCPSLAEPQTDLAYALWLQGKVDPALEAAKAALSLDPNDAAAHRYVGRLLLLRGGSRAEAIEHLQKAVQSNPEETDAHFDLAMAYREAGDMPNAWAQLRLLQTEFPEDEPRLLYLEGLLSSTQGRSSLAIDFFRRALAGDSRLPRARESLGVELAHAGHWTEALALLEPAARDNPQSFELSYLYALTLMNTRRWADAEAAARRAINLNPASSEARDLLAQVEAHSGSAREKEP
jgi:tetratricopeptide (TPR) repeat protein